MKTPTEPYTLKRSQVAAVRLINALAHHLPDCWREHLIAECGLEEDATSPHRPVFPPDDDKEICPTCGDRMDILARRAHDADSEMGMVAAQLEAALSEGGQWRMSAEASDAARASLGEKNAGLSAALQKIKDGSFTSSASIIELTARTALDKFGPKLDRRANE